MVALVLLYTWTKSGTYENRNEQLSENQHTKKTNQKNPVSEAYCGQMWPLHVFPK